MALEKLICPQCGGNDLKQIGAGLYKCSFCGGTYKDEPDPLPADHKVAAPDTNFRQEEYNTYESDDKDDSKSPGKVIGCFVFSFFLVITIIASLAKSCNESHETTDNLVIPYYDSDVMKIIPGIYDHDSSNDYTVPDMSVSPSYSENGITIKDVVLLDGTDTTTGYWLSKNHDLKLVLLKPKGFKLRKKKISPMITISITDHSGYVYFEKTDLIPGDSAGVDPAVYKKQITIPFSTNSSFGLNKGGDFLLNYTITDRYGEGNLTGTFPFFIRK
ncbi:MAG TPA: hypothetical protein VL651_04435 [Bacteroidia bacterium]|jgi:hypothetical protein|nr:hypothetical protein [Bacteroidia bacterium]